MGPGRRPEYLRQCVQLSLRRLEGRDGSICGNCTASTAKVPRDEQFSVIRDMQKEGLIRHVGLSQVNVEEIKAAQKFFHGRDGAE